MTLQLITDVPIIDANNVGPVHYLAKFEAQDTGSVAWDGQVELAYQSGHAFAKLTAIAVTGVPQTQTTQVKLSFGGTDHARQLYCNLADA